MGFGAQDAILDEAWLEALVAELRLGSKAVLGARLDAVRDVH